MKIILSHDVDHLSLLEHWKDLYIPGLLARSTKSLLNGDIKYSQFKSRFSSQLNNIRPLFEFNASLHIPQTYFFGTANGLSLSYHYQTAKPFIDFLLSQSADVGLHGQAFQDKKALEEEKNRLLELTGPRPVGIRNHYLRRAENTLDNMEKLGFVFDSTVSGLIPPFRIGSMWEIPISVMDVDIVPPAGGGNIKEIRKKTKALIEEAQEKQLPYFVINFHDVYFSGGWPLHRQWYTETVDILKSKGLEFVSFKQAVEELNDQNA